LRAHEQVIPGRVEELVYEIRRDGVLRVPILADARTLTILDGHHRTEALRRLGARWVPAVLVDYLDGPVTVESWKPGIKVSKREVLARAVQGRLYPPRTTRHRVLFDYPRIDLKISVLLDGDPAGREW